MRARLNLLPDPYLEPYHGQLQARLRTAGAVINQETFGDVFDSLMRSTLQIGFGGAGAHEGTVWLVDRARDCLVPVYNTGPDPEGFTTKVAPQPLSRGLISGVFAREQAFCENDVDRHASHDKSVDRTLGLVTTAMIAVPFYFAQEVRGVISCVQVKSASEDQTTESSGFPPASLRHVQFSAEVITRLIDYALLRAVLGNPLT